MTKVKLKTSNPISDHVGARIEEAIEMWQAKDPNTRLKMTPLEIYKLLAEHGGFHYSSVYRWLSGATLPNLDILEFLSEFLGVPIAYFISTKVKNIDFLRTMAQEDFFVSRSVDNSNSVIIENEGIIKGFSDWDIRHTRIADTSAEAELSRGDIVFYAPVNDMTESELYVLRFEEVGSVVRYLTRTANQEIKMTPFNRVYNEEILTKKMIASRQVMIRGVVMGQLRLNHSPESLEAIIKGTTQD